MDRRIFSRNWICSAIFDEKRYQYNVLGLMSRIGAEIFCFASKLDPPSNFRPILSYFDLFPSIQFSFRVFCSAEQWFAAQHGELLRIVVSLLILSLFSFKQMGTWYCTRGAL